MLFIDPTTHTDGIPQTHDEAKEQRNGVMLCCRHCFALKQVSPLSVHLLHTSEKAVIRCLVHNCVVALIVSQSGGLAMPFSEVVCSDVPCQHD